MGGHVSGPNPDDVVWPRAGGRRGPPPRAAAALDDSRLSRQVSAPVAGRTMALPAPADPAGWHPPLGTACSGSAGGRAPPARATAPAPLAPPPPGPAPVAGPPAR